MNIAELTITNVSHRKSKYFENEFEIRFVIDEFHYKLLMSQIANRLVHPIHVEHLVKNKTCPCCKERFTILCNELTRSKQELFHRLIEFPNIRLKWLYINHV